MDLGSLRTLALSVNFATHGVDATVTRPAPDDTPIAARVIFLTPETEDYPIGGEFTRRDAARVVALRRSEVPTVPIRTVIQAPELAGGTVKTWRVDGVAKVEADQVRVTVTLVS